MSFDGHKLSIKSGTCSWDLWHHLMARLSAIKSGICSWDLWCHLMDRLCPIKSGTCSWDLWCHLMARLSAIKSGTCAWSPWHHIYIWYLPNIVPGTDEVMAGHVQWLDQVQMDTSNPGWVLDLVQKPGPQEPFIWHAIRLQSNRSRWTNPCFGEVQKVQNGPGPARGWTDPEGAEEDTSRVGLPLR